MIDAAAPTARISASHLQLNFNSDSALHRAEPAIASMDLAPLQPNHAVV